MKRSHLGNRVLKEVHSGDINAPKAITWYVRAADGNVLAVYTKAGAPGPILTGENQEQQSIVRNAPPMAMAGEGGPGSGDEDSDGIGDIIDNCPGVSNPGQEDMDSDGMGDACDPDKDGDGIPNALDQCPDTYNPGQTDVNHDGCEDEQGGGTGGDIQLAELHIYGRSRLGMMKPDGVTMAPEENRVSHNVDVALDEHNSVYVRRVNRKQYELTDHLGNVRVVITDVKTTAEALSDNKPQGPYKATLLASNNYYPFGMLQPERHWSTGEYRYGYNGKEMDNETKGEGTSYDYGARMYDPRIAKFLSLDPLINNFAGMSPYHYAGNTPIWAIDKQGEYIYIYTNNKNVRPVLDVVAQTPLGRLVLDYFANSPDNHWYIGTNRIDEDPNDGGRISGLTTGTSTNIKQFSAGGIFNFSLQNLQPNQTNPAWSILIDAFSVLNGMPLDQSFFSNPKSTHYATIFASERPWVFGLFWSDYFDEQAPSISDMRDLATTGFHEPTAHGFLYELYKIVMQNTSYSQAAANLTPPKSLAHYVFEDVALTGYSQPLEKEFETQLNSVSNNVIQKIINNYQQTNPSSSGTTTNQQYQLPPQY